MATCFRHGDRILAGPIGFGGPIKRGNVVIFRSKALEPPHFSLKRAIGLPGETIRIDVGKVYVNELKLDDFTNGPMGTYNFGPLQIPPAHYFLMGDNRSVAIDSRDFGPVPIEDIFYKALMIYKPLHRIKFLI